MFKNKVFVYLLIAVLFVSFTGCGGLQRKFVRKKKKEEKPAPVITMHDYGKDLRVGELYKKHFLYWKTWQTELIDRIDGTYKKRIECYDHSLMHLLEMERYLGGTKAEELQVFIAQIKSIDPDIRKKRLSKSEILNITHLLEKTKRQIDKKFSYLDVKNFLEFKR